MFSPGMFQNARKVKLPLKSWWFYQLWHLTNTSWNFDKNRLKGLSICLWQYMSMSTATEIFQKPHLPYSAKWILHKCSLTDSLALTWLDGAFENTVVRGGWKVGFFFGGLVLKTHSSLSLDLKLIQLIIIIIVKRTVISRTRAILCKNK